MFDKNLMSNLKSSIREKLSFLQCELLKGVVPIKDTKLENVNNGISQDDTIFYDIEEGNLSNSHVISTGEHMNVVIVVVADGKLTSKL